MDKESSQSLLQEESQDPEDKVVEIEGRFMTCNVLNTNSSDTTTSGQISLESGLDYLCSGDSRLYHSDSSGTIPSRYDVQSFAEINGDMCRERFGISEENVGTAAGFLIGGYSLAVFCSSFFIGCVM